MLKIRRLQLDALAALSRRRFATDAGAYLRRVHPERWATVVDAPLRAWVERRLARGLQLGLVEELSLLHHLEVASRLDERFADSNDALAVLQDLDGLRRWPEPMALLECLHRATVTT